MDDREEEAMPISSHQAVDALLDQVFAANPMHPAHHYRIHLWDEEKAARALVAASLCGQTAPGIAHMWHMPGHIYSKLHRYADAAWQQEASARVDHAHMMRDRVLPDQIHNYAHNNEWLIRNLTYRRPRERRHRPGQEHDRTAAASQVQHLPRRQRPASGTSGWSTCCALRTVGGLRPMPTRLPQAAEGQADDKLKRLRHAGAGPVWAWQCRRGAQQIAAVEELLEGAARSPLHSGRRGRSQSPRRQEIGRRRGQAMADALAKPSPELKNIEHVLAELRGYAALAANNPAEAKTQFEKSKMPDSATINWPGLLAGWRSCRSRETSRARL